MHFTSTEQFRSQIHAVLTLSKIDEEKESCQSNKLKRVPWLVLLCHVLFCDHFSAGCSEMFTDSSVTEMNFFQTVTTLVLSRCYICFVLGVGVPV